MHASAPLTFAYNTSSYAGNPAVAPGTAITAGFSDADGSVLPIIGTPLTHDVELLEVVIGCATSNAQAGVDTSMLLDLLIDPAGGTAWDTTNLLVEGLLAGYMLASSSGLLGCRRWRFPLWIPAGATIGGRARSHAPSGAVDVVCQLIARGKVNRPAQWWCGQKVDAIGINRAASGGTTIAPNATTNTYGSWTSVGSPTARRYGALLPFACAIGSAVVGTAHQTQVGHDSGTQRGPTFNSLQTAAEGSSPFQEENLILCDIPEGTQLQARKRASSASSSSDQIIIHGVA